MKRKQVRFIRCCLATGLMAALTMVMAACSSAPASAPTPALSSIPATPASTPVPRNPLNSNFATEQGTLAVTSGGIIIITPNGTPVTLNPPSNQAVNIVYNSSTGTIQGIMLGTPGQVGGTPRTLSNQNFATEQGTLAVTSSGIITIIPPSGSATLAVPTNPAVNIVYNSTQIIQGIMLGSSGYVGGTPRTQSNRNFATEPGTLTAVSGTSIAITPSNSSVALVAPSNATTVTIIYSSSNGALQGIMLNRSGQAGGIPRTRLNQNFATEQGTLAVSGNSIAITPIGSIVLTLPSNTAVTILYNNSTGAVQGIILNMSE
jgi:hypothetical protein